LGCLNRPVFVDQPRIPGRDCQIERSALSGTNAYHAAFADIDRFPARNERHASPRGFHGNIAFGKINARPILVGKNLDEAVFVEIYHRAA
jgi:hypothetical protein